MLQWGLGLSTEEGPLRRVCARQTRRGFNGASVFQPRKGHCFLPSPVIRTRLQWGLGLSTEEGLSQPVMP